MTDGAAATGAERPALVLRDLRKAFGSTVAVDGVDLEVRRGEFLTLLGPSGSGKTTTLRMIAGFMSPTGGTIELDGQDMTRVPPYRRDVGMVFQNYALFPHMTAAQNVGLPSADAEAAAGRDRTARRGGARPRQARVTWAIGTRGSCPAASSSGSRSHERSSSSRGCC